MFKFESIQLPPQITAFWLQLQQQAEANPRLRWMLWGIFYIFIIYFALSLGEWSDSKGQSIAQLQRTEIKLEHLETQTEWPQRLAQEEATAQRLRAKLWQAQSPGLAEADLQNFLRRIMLAREAQGTRLHLAPTETLEIGRERLFKVSAEVTGVVAVEQIDALMHDFAINPQVLLVERFGYSPQTAGQLSILVTGYFLEKKADEATSAAVGGPVDNGF